MPLQSRGSNVHSLWQYGLLFSVYLQTSAAGGSDSPSTSRNGYSFGQAIPVTCLNRTIDSGEHITDNQGNLQYIPFPICNETSLPLALHYGVSETVNCTIAALPDELYHLLEYYVHSDVPMTCRVPTAPLAQHLLSMPSSEGDSEAPAAEPLNEIDTDGPSYTPLTFALQGTLQRSHLHIWTDMNLLAHNIAAGGVAAQKKQKKKAAAAAGYVVAGTAYSVPEFDVIVQKQMRKKHTSDEEQAAQAAVAEAAKDPWTAGHGTKVIRGEPLTFSFHVTWVEGGRGIGWPSSGRASLAGQGTRGDDGAGAGFFSRLVFFVMAAGVGAIVALYWERNGGSLGMRRRRGEGILGVSSSSSRGKLGGGSVGITYGNGGKMNGYGGYSSAGVGNGAAGAGYGYGGYNGSGKRD
ncbi:uncharacterized protein BP01DRAFT_390140 [Aspergillus saccharolyticus JOP 1030-1]|uniref:Uncharacterized protein n=1 Tax=Aspergillus saccharolyticus JOP 1030-1 TaxID=1450539 RepID=A0A318ZUF0_9EURO|nr:hypothetical protein BP01DRAFT_390140 [Aspergillus saccharolyticus JOP 1030-1]PYH47620.1 hypothetical protein BP01DRAFT_390140 [Aspergillus saccharolyticus JOP 1030-1]